MKTAQAHHLQDMQECNNANFAREIGIVTLQNLLYDSRFPNLCALRASVVQFLLLLRLLFPLLPPRTSIHA